MDRQWRGGPPLRLSEEHRRMIIENPDAGIPLVVSALQVPSTEGEGVDEHLNTGKTAEGKATTKRTSPTAGRKVVKHHLSKDKRGRGVRKMTGRKTPKTRSKSVKRKRTRGDGTVQGRRVKGSTVRGKGNTKARGKAIANGNAGDVSRSIPTYVKRIQVEGQRALLPEMDKRRLALGSWRVNATMYSTRYLELSKFTVQRIYWVDTTAAWQHRSCDRSSYPKMNCDEDYLENMRGWYENRPLDHSRFNPNSRRGNIWYNEEGIGTSWYDSNVVMASLILEVLAIFKKEIIG